jgi:hypothetical protein
MKEIWDFKGYYIDFYTNKKNEPILSFVLLAGAILLMCLNLYNLCTTNDSYSYWGIGGNLLVAISQALNIKKHAREKNLDSV